MNTSIESILLVVFSSVIGAFGGFLFNKASKKLSFSLEIIRNYSLIGGLILFAAAAVVYIFALTRGELNVLYPISALTYVWSSILAKAYLSEEINSYKWCGISLIILGAIFIVN